VNPRIDKSDAEPKSRPAARTKGSRVSTVSAPLTPIVAYLRNDPLDDLRARISAVEIRLGIEPGARLYRMEESEPPAAPKVERLTSPQLVFVDEPNEETTGPAGEGPVRVEPEEEQPGEKQPAEEMEVDVPEEAARVEVPVEAQVEVAPVEVPEEVRANPPPEEDQPEPEIKVEPVEGRVPRPKEVIKGKIVPGKFKDVDVVYIELLSD